MHLRPAIAGLALALLAACGGSPKPRLYVLTPAEGATAPAGAAFASSIVVGPVTVPEVLDQPQMVVQAAGNQVTLQEYHRWASPLTSEIGRVIAANLARELGATRVWSYPQTALPAPDIQVIVDVRRFDSAPGATVTIDTVWTVRRKSSETPQSGRSLVREAVSGADFDAIAAAHSRALAQVSRDIAAAIR